MTYDFLVETYATERVKVVSVWSEFTDADLAVRPGAVIPRTERARTDGAPVRQRGCLVSQHAGHRRGAPPLPQQETRLEFIRRYAEDSGRRLAALRETKEPWWEENVRFFDVSRSRAWILTRRIAHTSHHRGQLMAMLRMLGHDVHSNYGPTADTGGLMQHHAPTIYAYPSLKALLEGEAAGGAKAVLPGATGQPVTERPDAAAALQDVSKRNADLTSKSHHSSH